MPLKIFYFTPIHMLLTKNYALAMCQKRFLSSVLIFMKNCIIFANEKYAN